MAGSTIVNGCHALTESGSSETLMCDQKGGKGRRVMITGAMTQDGVLAQRDAVAVSDLRPRPLPSRMIDMGRDNGVGPIAQRMARDARQAAQPALIFFGALPGRAAGAGGLAGLERRARQAGGAHQNATR